MRWMKKTQDALDLPNYDSVEKVLKQQEITPLKASIYHNKVIKEGKYKRNQLKGHKAWAKTQFKMGQISEAERQIRDKRIDDARVVLHKYTTNYESKVKSVQGYGLPETRRGQRGRGVVFFNIPRELFNK